MPLHLIIHRENYSVARLRGRAAAALSDRAVFSTMSRLGNETTVVCLLEEAPPGAEVRDGFRLVEIQGDFALDSTGVVAAVAQPLAAAGISLFAFSVWNTDVFLVQSADVDGAERALSAAGHEVIRR